jgi:hypothetical protein
VADFILLVDDEPNILATITPVAVSDRTRSLMSDDVPHATMTTQ